VTNYDNMKGSDNDDTKCPCCNNPWAAATAEFFCKMCDEDEAEPEKLTDPIDFDDTISPSDNFYIHSNKKWMDDNPIPSGYPNWNTFLILNSQSQERLKDLLNDNDKEEVEVEVEGKDGDNDEGNCDADKVSAFYSSAMDEESIERAGIASLEPVLELVERTFRAATKVKESATKDEKLAASAEVATCLGEMLAMYGISAFFNIYASPDNKNSKHTTCQLVQGGIGLPDKDYYFDEDKEDKRTAYKKHVTKMLTLLQQDQTAAATTTTIADEDPTSSTDAIYSLELRLADKHMTKTENRDPEATYNPMTLQSLTSDLCHDSFDFPAFFSAATGGRTGEQLGEINVSNTTALECAAEAICDVEPNVLRHYLRWRVVQSTADYLSKNYVEEDFDFNERVLKGTEEIKPRWKRAMAFTESALGEALGQMYCKKYFDEGCKEKALAIVENVRQALEDRLKEVDWIASESTRIAALEKMKSFNVKIGYPNQWINYSRLDIQAKDSFLDMVFKSRVFDHILEVEKMNAVTDTEKWFMTPQTVNAYYHPMLNEIVFPAAILQPPFFDKNADDALNYGAMGAVVGHEMSHGFDDQGRKFNADGNMIDWWTKEDGEEYERRVEVMVRQVNAVQVYGQNVKGKLTCGENIADLGGLRLALRALRAQSTVSQDETGSATGGLTSTQKFFYGWSRCWRRNINKERALQLLTLDPHGPNDMRCNGPLSNMQEFIDAFNISEDSPMYKAPEDRVNIW